MNVITRAPLRVRHQTKLRLLQVAQVEVLSPHMRRITLAGDALDGFVSAAADDHVKLFFPAPGQERPVLPMPGPAGPVYPDGAVPPVVRDYTPRRFDADRRELAIEFVVHGDGPASGWAAQAQPGQWLGVGGPRGSFLVPEDYDSYLLIGDETALPAIARQLEEMRPGTLVQVLIEVADRTEERKLPTAAQAAITWLHRDGIPAGRSPMLPRAVEALRWPRGDGHAWIAGEIETVRAVRRFLVDQRGLPRSQIRATGYWRLGEADAHGTVDD